MSIKPNTQPVLGRGFRAPCFIAIRPLIVEKLKEFEKLGKGSIGLVGIDHFTMIPHNVYETIVSSLPKAHFKDETDFYTEFQMISSEEQIQFMRKSGRDWELGFEAELKAGQGPGLKKY